MDIIYVTKEMKQNNCGDKTAILENISQNFVTKVNPQIKGVGRLDLIGSA